MYVQRHSSTKNCCKNMPNARARGARMGGGKEVGREVHMFSQAHSKRPVQATRDGNQLCPVTPPVHTRLPLPLLLYFLQEANNFYFSGGNYKHETRNMNSFSFVCKRILPTSPSPPSTLRISGHFPAMLNCGACLAEMPVNCCRGKYVAV